MPQKPSPLKPPPLPKNRNSAWGIAVANQLALPGLGTVMAGRKIGYVELAFSICGLLLTTRFLFWCFPNIGDWFPPPEDERQIIANFEKWMPWFMIAGSGIISFFIGWCMAFFSSRSIIREQSAGGEQR